MLFAAVYLHLLLQHHTAEAGVGGGAKGLGGEDGGYKNCFNIYNMRNYTHKLNYIVYQLDVSTAA